MIELEAFYDCHHQALKYLYIVFIYNLYIYLYSVALVAQLEIHQTTFRANVCSNRWRQLIRTPPSKYSLVFAFNWFQPTVAVSRWMKSCVVFCAFNVGEKFEFEEFANDRVSYGWTIILRDLFFRKLMNSSQRLTEPSVANRCNINK